MGWASSGWFGSTGLEDAGEIPGRSAYARYDKKGRLRVTSSPKDNHYVRRYGVRLRPDLYAGLNPLPYAEAQRMEQVLARELRHDGYAVWQK